MQKHKSQCWQHSEIQLFFKSATSRLIKLLYCFHKESKGKNGNIKKFNRKSNKMGRQPSCSISEKHVTAITFLYCIAKQKKFHNNANTSRCTTPLPIIKVSEIKETKPIHPMWVSYIFSLHKKLPSPKVNILKPTLTTNLV